jgi:hypothetical protein
MQDLAYVPDEEGLTRTSNDTPDTRIVTRYLPSADALHRERIKKKQRILFDKNSANPFFKLSTENFFEKKLDPLCEALEKLIYRII